MSGLSIHETLTLSVPPERVWRTLLDPEKVALCLPGASLEGAEDERTFRGSMRISVGPVTVSYRGTIVFEEVDHAARCVRVSGRGREATGSGSATLSMESRVSASGAGSLVTVDSDVHVTGKLVSFGRGMIERVSQEILRDFTGRLDALLASEQEVSGEPATSTSGGAEPRGAPPPSAALSAPRLLWRVIARFFADLFRRRPRS